MRVTTHRFSSAELRTKEVLGLPIYALGIAYATIGISGNVLLSLAVALGAWYVYNRLYWFLYKRYVLATSAPRPRVLYFTVGLVDIVALVLVIRLFVH